VYICHRYIKEIGLNDVELANMDLAEKQHKTPEFLQVSHTGQQQALTVSLLLPPEPTIRMLQHF